MSILLKEYNEERKYEDRELEWRENNVSGWSRHDLACLGAGGKGKLTSVVSRAEKDKLLENINRRIKSIEYEMNVAAAVDIRATVVEVEIIINKIKILKEICIRTTYYKDGSSMDFLDNEKFWERSLEYRYRLYELRKMLYKNMLYKKLYYNKLLLKLSDYQKKIKEDIK